MTWDEIPDLGGRVEPPNAVPVLDLQPRPQTGYASDPVVDPLAGTPFARVRIPGGVTGFGFGEMRLLLAGQDSPASRASAVVLGIDEALDAPEILAAAASSLLGRGLMAVDAAGAFHPAGEAALVESMFATAFRWTSFTFRVGERADLLVMVEAEGQVGLWQARQYGTWFVALPGSVADPAGLAADGMGAMAALYGSGTFAVQVRSPDRVHSTLYVAGAEPTDWSVTTALGGDEVLARGTVPEMVRWVLREMGEVSG